MACPEAVMNQETKYLEALQACRAFRMGGTLPPDLLQRVRKTDALYPDAAKTRDALKKIGEHAFDTKRADRSLHPAQIVIEPIERTPPGETKGCPLCVLPAKATRRSRTLPGWSCIETTSCGAVVEGHSSAMAME